MARKTDVRLDYHRDVHDRLVLTASRKKGKLTTQNVIEAMEREDIYGTWYVPLHFSGDLPDDLYDDGDSWVLYDADDIDEVVAEARYNQGYEDGQRDAESYWQDLARRNGWRLP